MDEVFQQWNDGLITDNEFSMKMLDEFHKCASKYLEHTSNAVSRMLESERQRYWYRLEKLGAKDYEPVKDHGAKPLLLTKDEAAMLNRATLEGYRWYSKLAETGEM